MFFSGCFCEAEQAEQAVNAEIVKKLLEQHQKQKEAGSGT